MGTEREHDAEFERWLASMPAPRPSRRGHFGYGWAREAFHAGWVLGERHTSTRAAPAEEVSDGE